MINDLDECRRTFNLALVVKFLLFELHLNFPPVVSQY